MEIGIYEASLEDDNAQLEFYLSPFGLEKTLSGPSWVELNANKYVEKEAEEVEQLLVLMVKKAVG